MAQLIPTVPGIGAQLGSGISKTLSALVDDRINQMAEARQFERQQSQQQQIAKVLAYLSGAPEGEGVQQFNKPSQPSIEQLSGAQQAQQLGAPRIQKNPIMEALQRGNVSRDELDQLAGIAPRAPEPTQEFQQRAPSTQAAQTLQRPRQLTREKLQELLAATPQHLQPQVIAAYQAQQAKEATKEKEFRKEHALNQREINARTQPFYDKIIEGEKSAKQVKHTLKKLQSIKEENLPPASLYNALNSLESIGIKEVGAVGSALGAAEGAIAGGTLGGPIGALIGGGIGAAKGGGIGAAIGAAMKPINSLLRSALIGIYPDTEEFEKTSLEFLKNVRPLIGGHVTENQLDLFIKAIPTLATTAHGRKQIINNMGVIAEGATAEYDALEEVIKKNGGKRPDNLEFDVERLADEKRKKYAKRWEA